MKSWTPTVKRLSSDTQEARLKNARALLKSARYEEAQTQFQSLLEEDPHFAGAQLGLAKILKKKGLFLEALKILQQAKQKDALNAQFYIAEGQIFFHQKQWEEAKSAFHTALDISPTADAAALNLGRIYLQEHAYEKAVEVLTPLSQSSHEKVAQLASRSLMRALLALKNPKTAADMLAKRQEKRLENRVGPPPHPRNAQRIATRLQLRQVELYFQSADYAGALSRLKDLQGTSPNTLQRATRLKLDWLMGECHFHLENFSEAEAIFRRLGQSRPKMPLLRLLLIQCVLRQVGWTPELDTWSKTLPNAPRFQAFLYQIKGDKAYCAKDYTAAMAAYQEALQRRNISLETLPRTGESAQVASAYQKRVREVFDKVFFSI